jgi:hypothetical protein
MGLVNLTLPLIYKWHCPETGALGGGECIFIKSTKSRSIYSFGAGSKQFAVLDSQSEIFPV